MDGVVTGVQGFGLFVQGIALPAEGFIHVTSLADDYYQFDAAAHSLVGRRRGNAFRLGDFVRVAVAHVDVDRRELDFRLVDRLKQGTRGAAQGRGKSGSRGKSATAPRKAKGRPTRGAGKQKQGRERPAAGNASKKKTKKKKKKKRKASRRSGP